MLDESPTPQQLTTYNFYRGRVALYAILKALGLRRGDEVAVQAFTCVAVPEGVMATGATPVYIDTGTDSVNMDPQDLDRKLTTKTRAIVVQHTFGIPADMEAILSVAEARGIPVIEDCCHALRSHYKGRRLGSLGAAAFYSFEWGKPVVAGVGGSAVINDGDLREQVAKVYNDFSQPAAGNRLRMDVQYWFFNLLYRPSFYWPVRSLFHRLSDLGVAESNYNPVQADGKLADDFRFQMISSVRRRLLRKLDNLEYSTNHRQHVAEKLASGIVHPIYGNVAVPRMSEVVYARFPLWIDEKQQLLLAARKHNIEIAEWYATPIHPLEPHEWGAVGYQAGSCSEAERAARRIISLPTHEKTSPDNVNRITDFLNEFARSR